MKNHINLFKQTIFYSLIVPNPAGGIDQALEGAVRVKDCLFLEIERRKLCLTE